MTSCWRYKFYSSIQKVKIVLIIIIIKIIIYASSRVRNYQSRRKRKDLRESKSYITKVAKLSKFFPFRGFLLSLFSQEILKRWRRDKNRYARDLFVSHLAEDQKEPPSTVRGPRSGGQTPEPEQRPEQCRYRRTSRRSSCDVLSCSSNSQHSREPFESPWKPRVSESRALRFSARRVSVARTWRGCASRRTCHRGVRLHPIRLRLR